MSPGGLPYPLPGQRRSGNSGDNYTLFTWAEDGHSRIQGPKYEPTTGPTQKANPDERTDIDKSVKRLVVESVQAATANGFLTGLGGFAAMSVSIPVNMAGALVINSRLAAATAYLRGYDPKDPHVRTVATLIAAGSNSQQIAKSVGIKVGGVVRGTVEATMTSVVGRTASRMFPAD